MQIPRVPIICTGNDFSTLYAPLIRDGRMEKFYWSPTREDRIGEWPNSRFQGPFRTKGQNHMYIKLRVPPLMTGSMSDPSLQGHPNSETPI